MASKSRTSQMPRTAPSNPVPLNKSPLKMSVVSPLTECRFCKREFGSASISIHEKQCEKKQANAAASSRSGFRVAERHRDIGPSRPKTRTLKRDVLTRGGGNQPPLIKPNSFSLPTLNCAACGTVIPSTKMLVHLRVCNPPTLTSEVVEVQCPLNGGRHDCKAMKAKSEHTSTTSSAAIRRPRTIICYICGREYGSKSISIHEPQCLKKWHIENNQLPISERKPPPVKPAAKTTTSTANATEDMPLPTLTRSEGRPTSDEMMEAYFQNCYHEFEKELIPCGRCGRKFAPERYNRHTKNCNAQPLATAKQQKK